MHITSPGPQQLCSWAKLQAQDNVPSTLSLSLHRGPQRHPCIRPSPGTSLLPASPVLELPVGSGQREAPAETWKQKQAGQTRLASTPGSLPTGPQQAGHPPRAAVAQEQGLLSPQLPAPGPQASVATASVAALSLYSLFPPQPPRSSMPFPAGTPSGTSFSFQDASDKALLFTRERNMRKPQSTCVGCPQDHPQAR